MKDAFFSLSSLTMFTGRSRACPSSPGVPLLLSTLVVLSALTVVVSTEYAVTDCSSSSSSASASASAGANPDPDPLTGWRAPPSHHLELDSDVCNIPKVTLGEWQLYLTDREAKRGKSTGREQPIEPMIITYDVETLNAEFVRRCRKGELLRLYANSTITLSSANTHSYEKRATTLDTYLATMMAPREMEDYAASTFYHFGDNNYEDWVNFTDHYVRPPFPYKREPFFSFGIGGSGSGVPFHTHGAVFAEVLYGKKRWFLTHPDNKPTFHPDETSYSWFYNSHPAASRQQGFLDCTLKPGEVLFIDSQWWHSTLNIGETVFISTFL